MQTTDQIYLDQLRYVRDTGRQRDDRTGTGTIGIFGLHGRFDISNAQIPLLTTKSVHFHSVKHELLWFLSGSTNIQYLKDNKVRIWNEWADEAGEVGRIYGPQMRSFRGFGRVDQKVYVDQIKVLIEDLKTNPWSRRHLVTMWNPAELDQMNLPPCPVMLQFYVEQTFNGKRLSCHLYQRSADMFLGVPFDLASYSLLTHMIAHVCGMETGELVYTMGDAHIYLNHLEQVEEQLSRVPDGSQPLVFIDHITDDIDSIRGEDIRIENYNPQPAIKAQVSV